jgi:serine protease Do
MKALSVGLIVSLLGGCATAERLLIGPDQARDNPLVRTVHARPKAKIAKQAKPWPLALVSVSEPELPPWSIPAPRPSGVLRWALTPSQLFSKVSPAVYAVVVQGHSQGSAVAVSSKEAITNCHVVNRPEPIMLVNAAATHRAEVVSADRPTDRCYLRVLDGELQPVQGFRDYATLAVGEVVFTIGSPKGLVNTLGHGLLSGLRTLEDAEYIQITAPVSKGSSGGGLFDDRGNLIGVTTFTIQDSQNLNFAIAASHYWR